QRYIQDPPADVSSRVHEFLNQYLNMNTEEPTKSASSRPQATTPLQFIAETSEQLLKIYSELRFVGYLAIVGALIILATLCIGIFSNSPGHLINLDFSSQVLFVSAGFGLILVGGGFLALQNFLSYWVEMSNHLAARQAMHLRHQRAAAAAQEAAKEPDKSAYKPIAG